MFAANMGPRHWYKQVSTPAIQGRRLTWNRPLADHPWRKDVCNQDQMHKSFKVIGWPPSARLLHWDGAFQVMKDRLRFSARSPSCPYQKIRLAELRIIGSNSKTGATCIMKNKITKKNYQEGSLSYFELGQHLPNHRWRRCQRPNSDAGSRCLKLWYTLVTTEERRSWNIADRRFRKLRWLNKNASSASAVKGGSMGCKMNPSKHCWEKYRSQC